MPIRPMQKTPPDGYSTLAQHISAVTLVVPDYDAGIDFYVRILGFDLIEDTALSQEKRWVLVAPPGSTECHVA